jgi:late competence protein required for DNA uptake (superfamily II DNA/RNA helicase)
MMRGTVRCPYCVTGLEFHPMVAHVDGRHICNKCGHTTGPSDAEYECRCPKCRKFASPDRRYSGKQHPLVRA